MEKILHKHTHTVSSGRQLAIVQLKVTVPMLFGQEVGLWIFILNVWAICMEKIHITTLFSKGTNWKVII